MNIAAAWPLDQVPSPDASLAKRQPERLSGVRWAVIAVVSILSGWVAGFRLFGIGRDFGEYLIIYEIIGRGFWTLALRYEPGFMFTTLIFKSLTGLPLEYFYSLLVIFSLGLKQYLFHKYTRYAGLATIAYFMLLFPIHEYTQIRAAVGIGLGFWGIHLTLERRWIPAAICFAAGISFHYTVVLIPLAFIPAILLNSRIRVAIAALVGAASLGLGNTTVVPRVYELANRFNPLSDVYVASANRSVETVNLFSVANLALYASLAVSFAMPWFNRDSYRRVFMIMAMGSVAAMVLFVDTPVYAHRLREVLVFSFLFFAYREARTELEWAPAVLVLFASAVSLYSTLIEGSIINMS